MALDGTYHHRKIRKLARAMRIKPWAALGLMEAVWHWARKSARTGRIERDQWDDLAEHLQWDTSADTLRETLIEQQLVDPMPEGWDWIHDWHLHADKSVREALEYTGQTFANGAEARRHRKASATYPQPIRNPDCGKEAISATQVAENPEKIAATARARPEPVPEPVPEPEKKKNTHATFPAFDGPDPQTEIARLIDQVMQFWASPGPEPQARLQAQYAWVDSGVPIGEWCVEALERCRKWDTWHRTRKGVRTPFLYLHFSGDHKRDPPEPMAEAPRKLDNLELAMQQIRERESGKCQ